MIVGIDYSINSPGICILNDDGIHFGTLARNHVAKPEFFETLRNYDVHTWDHARYKAIGNSTLDAQGFTNDAMKQAIALSEMCKTINQGKGDIDKNVAIFEGFSFGSKGNRLAQLAGYQYVARAQLIQTLINHDKLYVYAPQSVKSVAGAAKRGEGKVGMVQRFIEHEDKLPGLENHPFYIEMAKNEDSLLRKKPTKRKPIGDWCKPTDDIIDAYWIVYTYLKKNNISF
jgi:hypothetical protein